MLQPRGIDSIYFLDMFYLMGNVHGLDNITVNKPHLVSTLLFKSKRRNKDNPILTDKESSTEKMVKCFHCKHWDLSLDPGSTPKKPGRAASACNPSTGKEETGGCLEFTFTGQLA